jgi:hypothetical protein
MKTVVLQEIFFKPEKWFSVILIINWLIIADCGFLIAD